MTTIAIAPGVDPSGLNGERITRDEVYSPDVVELWLYPSSIGFESIAAAWRRAPRRGRELVLSVTPYKQDAGRLFVSVRLYVEPEPARLHIEEPDL